MNYTPARRQRENEKNAAARDEGKQKNEQKYHEFKITCDTTGDPGACHSLGEWWSMMRSDFVKAAEIYEVGCFVKSYPQSCLSLGRMLDRGAIGVARCRPHAVRSLVRGCDLGSAEACEEAGKILLRRAVDVSTHGMIIASEGGDALITPPAAPPPAVAPPAAAAPPPSTAAPVAPPPPVDEDTATINRAASTLILEASRVFSVGCSGASNLSNHKNCGMLGALYLSAPLHATMALKPPPVDLMPEILMPREGTGALAKWAEAHPKAPPPPRFAATATAGGGDGAVFDVAKTGAHARGLYATGVDALSRQAPDLLTRACDSQHIPSCLKLSRLYRHGAPDIGLAADAGKADLYEDLALKFGGISGAQAERLKAGQRQAARLG